MNLNYVVLNLMMSKSAKSSKEDTKKLEQKLGEVLGLERAAQKAVEELNSMKLLQSDTKKEILEIKKEASSHEEKITQIISDLSSEENNELNISEKEIEETAKETEKKATKMMKTYLGEDPDSSEAIEFLSIAEGGEVIHYEVLNAICKNFKIKELSNTVSSILKEEQDHLQRCITLAKENVS